MFFYSKEEALDKLSSSESGLDSARISDHKKKYGANKVDEAKKESVFVAFLRQFQNLMIIILLLSAGVSITLALTSGEYADLFEGFIILFIVIMNAIIGVIQENKAQASLADLKKHIVQYSKVVRSGVVMHISSDELVVGDIVCLEAGDIVPADLRLIETHSLKCDESSLTGESLPVEKNANLILNKHTAINEQKNMAFSGCSVSAGRAKGVVVAVGNQTEIGKIANMIFSTKKEQTPLQKSLQKIGKVITISVLVVCVVIFLLEIFFASERSVLSALMTSVALAVAAIPESLPAVITIIMAMGVTQLAKRKVIIKQLHAVETLGSCQVICSDKTGTLTQNKMTLTHLYLNLERCEADTGTDEYTHAINCMALCNECTVSKGAVLGEPTEVALYEYAMPHFALKKHKRLFELPFDSTRKMMTTVHSIGGIVSYTKGAFDMVIERCSTINIHGKIQALTPDIRRRLQAINKEMADSSLRVLALCYKAYDEYNMDADLERDMTFLGLVGMIDPPRVEVYDAIQKCFSAGLKPVMITGDHKNTAFAIARRLHIADSESQVLTGEQINAMSDAQFARKVGDYTVFARVTPEHKVKIVTAIKKQSKVVAMTGDGINDAPSLKIADIGVGMGISGTDVVKNVSDMVITDDNFASIVVAVEEGRKVYSNIQKALQYLLSTNMIEVVGMLLGLIFFPNVTFLTASQMLFINLVTDSLPAFALGVEKAEKDIMTRAPRSSRESVFSRSVTVGIVYQSILQLICVMSVYVLANIYATPEVANTMVFFTIIFVQTLHSINAKTNGSILDINIFENKTFNICFVVTTALNSIVAFVPIVRRMFGLCALSASQWVWVMVASLAIIPSVEIVKLVLYGRNRKTK